MEQLASSKQWLKFLLDWAEPTDWPNLLPSTSACVKYRPLPICGVQECSTVAKRTLKNGKLNLLLLLIAAVLKSKRSFLGTGQM